jgi:hypothetical protein
MKKSIYTTRDRALQTKHDRKGIARVPHVLINGVEHKSCVKCGSLKPLTEFHHSEGKVDGLSSYCKQCRSTK